MNFKCKVNNDHPEVPVEIGQPVRICFMIQVKFLEIFMYSKIDIDYNSIKRNHKMTQVTVLCMTVF